MISGMCTESGCDQAARLAWGKPGPWCQRHHRERYLALWTPYRDAHRQLEKVRGRAAVHRCSCGAPARQWAYVGPRDPGQRYPWSLRFEVDYEPQCVSCHKAADLAVVGHPRARARC